MKLCDNYILAYFQKFVNNLTQIFRNLSINLHIFQLNLFYWLMPRIALFAKKPCKSRYL